VRDELARRGFPSRSREQQARHAARHRVHLPTGRASTPTFVPGRTRAAVRAPTTVRPARSWS